MAAAALALLSLTADAKPAIAATARVRWSSIQGLFPGPKPRTWALAEEDLAPWVSQSAARIDASVGVGAESR